MTDNALEHFPVGALLPEAPTLVRVVGQSAVYVVDETTLRHVSSPAVMDAWRLRWDAIEELDEAAFAAFTVGRPWPLAPYLARGTGAAVYVIDTPPPGEPDPLPPGGQPTDDESSGGCSSTDDRSAGFLLILLVLGIFRWIRSRHPRFD